MMYTFFVSYFFLLLVFVIGCDLLLLILAPCRSCVVSCLSCLCLFSCSNCFRASQSIETNTCIIFLFSNMPNCDMITSLSSASFFDFVQAPSPEKTLVTAALKLTGRLF